jgi:capsid protein
MSWQIDWATLPENNEIQIPVGMDIEHVKRSCGWVPDGMPWFDRSREVKPALTAIAGGIESLGNLVQQLHGMDLDDWLNKLQDEQELVNDSGVDLANWDKVEGLYDSEEDVLDADAV